MAECFVLFSGVLDLWTTSDFNFQHKFLKKKNKNVPLQGDFFMYVQNAKFDTKFTFLASLAHSLDKLEFYGYLIDQY